MKRSVIDNFHNFNADMEGVCYHMYLDDRGYVTTAMGLYINSIPAAQALEWYTPSGDVATKAEVASEWQSVKDMQDKKANGGDWFTKVTKLRLRKEGMEKATSLKMYNTWDHLVRRFPFLADSCADLQMLFMSMAWAMGPGFTDKFPMFIALVKAGKLNEAAEECRIQEHNTTIAERNRRDKVLCLNAWQVWQRGLDKDKLYWPRELSADPDRPVSPGKSWEVKEDEYERK